MIIIIDLFLCFFPFFFLNVFIYLFIFSFLFKKKIIMNNAYLKFLAIIYVKLYKCIIIVKS